MKCEHVQELFPELKEHPEKYPEAAEHLGKCANCGMLFHIFEGLNDDRPVRIDPVKRDVNFTMIQKKMKHHDRVVFTRRVSSVAAVFLLAVVSIFNLNQTAPITLADISDDVLYLESEVTLVPDTGMDQEDIIEYLAEYENIESLGNLF